MSKGSKGWWHAWIRYSQPGWRTPTARVRCYPSRPWSVAVRIFPAGETSWAAGCLLEIAWRRTDDGGAGGPSIAANPGSISIARRGGCRISSFTPAERALWDGRFLVENTGRDRIAVHAGRRNGRIVRETDCRTACPNAVAKRAVKSAISFGVVAAFADLTDAQAGVPPTPLVQTHLGLYDTFLPCFDLMMANSIAALFGRDGYPAPPVHNV